MKILHITPSYEPAWHLGGVVRSVSQLCHGLAHQGHEVTVFTTDSGRDRRMQVPLNRPVDVGGVTVYYFKTDLSLKFCYSQALADACRLNIREFDIVHLTSFWCYPGIPGAHGAKRWGIPYVISTRGTFIPYSLKSGFLKKWLYMKLVEERILQQAQAIHYTAVLEREQMVQMGLRVPSFVIPNGLNSQEFNHLPEKSVVRDILGLPPLIQIILYLGRLHARKGLDFLLKAFAGVVNSTAPPLLILAGPDGGQERDLKELAASLGISDRVWFPGYLPPETRNLYLAAVDLAALVTHPGENFGNAAVEAMLAGLPVVVSENVGICREVEADGAGIVVPLEIADITAAINQMLGNPENLRAMGKAAASSARRRYDLNVVARWMAMAYHDIITGRRNHGLFWSDTSMS